MTPPAPSAADVDAVERLLGRRPQGAFEVVVRHRDGSPLVIRNAPLLDDGTPMPTRYWLVGEPERTWVGRLESDGGVDRAEGEVDAERARRRPRPLRGRARRRPPAGPRRPAPVGRGRGHPDRGQVPARALRLVPRRGRRSGGPLGRRPDRTGRFAGHDRRRLARHRHQLHPRPRGAPGRRQARHPRPPQHHHPAGAERRIHRPAGRRGRRAHAGLPARLPGGPRRARGRAAARRGHVRLSRRRQP